MKKTVFLSVSILVALTIFIACPNPAGLPPSAYVTVEYDLSDAFPPLPVLTKERVERYKHLLLNDGAGIFGPSSEVVAAWYTAKGQFFELGENIQVKENLVLKPVLIASSIVSSPLFSLLPAFVPLLKEEPNSSTESPIPLVLPPIDITDGADLTDYLAVLNAINIPQGIFGPFYVGLDLSASTDPLNTTVDFYTPGSPITGAEYVTALTLPELVTSIAANAFSGSGVAGFSNLQSIILPSGLQDIGDYAFAGTALTEITIPESAVNFGNSLFDSSNALTDIYFPSAIDPSAINLNVFDGLDPGTIIHVPAGKWSDYTIKWPGIAGQFIY